MRTPHNFDRCCKSCYRNFRTHGLPNDTACICWGPCGPHRTKLVRCFEKKRMRVKGTAQQASNSDAGLQVTWHRGIPLHPHLFQELLLVIFVFFPGICVGKNRSVFNLLVKTDLFCLLKTDLFLPIHIPGKHNKCRIVILGKDVNVVSILSFSFKIFIDPLNKQSRIHAAFQAS